MEEAIRGQDDSSRGAMFVDGLKAVLGAGGVKGASAGGEWPEKTPVKIDQLVAGGLCISIQREGGRCFRGNSGGERKGKGGQ